MVSPAFWRNAPMRLPGRRGRQSLAQRRRDRGCAGALSRRGAVPAQCERALRWPHLVAERALCRRRLGSETAFLSRSFLGSNSFRGSARAIFGPPYSRRHLYPACSKVPMVRQISPSVSPCTIRTSASRRSSAIFSAVLAFRAKPAPPTWTLKIAGSAHLIWYRSRMQATPQADPDQDDRDRGRRTSCLNLVHAAA